MDVDNPYRKTIRSLDDIATMSPMGRGSVEILRDQMKFDVAHDEHHIVRVTRNALWFSETSDKQSRDIIIASSVLHDLVNVPKDSPDRHMASTWSAKEAVCQLYGRCLIEDNSTTYRKIHNAIAAHSWSAGIEPTSNEAMAVQDADRVEALGNIGLARLFSVGGAMGRTMFHPTDPLAKNRELEEFTYTLDHYFVKLRNIVTTMRTSRGKAEATRLTQRMERFMQELLDEL